MSWNNNDSLEVRDSFSGRYKTVGGKYYHNLNAVIKEGDSGFIIYGEYTKEVIPIMLGETDLIQGRAICHIQKEHKIIAPWNLYSFNDLEKTIYSYDLSLGNNLSFHSDFSFKNIFCVGKGEEEYVYATKNEKKFIINLNKKLDFENGKVVELIEPENFTPIAMSIYKNTLFLGIEENDSYKIKIYKLEKTENFEIIK